MSKTQDDYISTNDVDFEFYTDEDGQSRMRIIVDGVATNYKVVIKPVSDTTTEVELEGDTA